MMSLRHRDSLTECNIFFVTTTVVGFNEVFADKKVCDILIANIKHYREKYKFTILAYAIMPSHFHWIVIADNNYGTISSIMRDIKKYSAWDIMEYLTAKDSRIEAAFKKAAEGYDDQKRKFWMPRFDDKVIRNEKMFWAKLHYIHNNPVEGGLVLKPEDYKYSSARNYVYGDQSVLEVDTEYAGVEIK